jgi:photosystem II stability/assembly factor-like uncharacterized protein
MPKRSFAMTVLLLVAAAVLGAQQPPPVRDLPIVHQSSDPILREFRYRSIGPASMGGRVDDIEAVESDPFTFYVGFATGGLWKTTNNGTSWTPLFDEQVVSSIGDIAIAPSNPSIVYVGTGEPNNRQSSTIGNGMYKSIDAGRTWTHIGLSDTQSIGRVVVDPKDPNVVYVAAVGHLFGPNKERGLFKTTDGGATWTNTKFIDENTGFIDVAMDPSDSRVLYATSYQRRRVPWGFSGGGPGSGLWKTSDAGKSWTQVAGSGFPEGTVGRLGVAVSRSKPNVIYAQIEVGPSPGTGAGVSHAGGKATDAQPGQGGGGGGGGQQQQQQQDRPPDPKQSGVWRSDDRGKTWRIMSNNNNRPMYYSQIRIDPTNDQIIYTMGASFYKSVDGGKTFRVVTGMGHGDHHALWVNPRNSRHLLLGHDGGFDVSYDQAETFDYHNIVAVGQFYAISADMRKPYYVYGGLQDNGSWGGPSATRGAGATNADWYRVGGGDGFYTANDPTDWSIVYAESQNGNMNRLDLKTGRGVSIRPRARPRRQTTTTTTEAADASQPAAGRRNPNPPREDQPVATAGQPAAPAQTQPAPVAPAQPGQPAPQTPGQAPGGFGQQQPQTSNIVPEPPAGTQFRFNWNTPLVLSPHDPRVVYTGSERFFKSTNRGDTWTMSGDLTKNIGRFARPIMGAAPDVPVPSHHDGTLVFGSITTIAESPARRGVIWVGTDDGNVQVSRDGGETFANVASRIQGVTGEYLVSRVEPSRFDAGTCYVTIDNHRNDDWKPYVFVTRDYGQTWTSIANNLPAMGNVNVIEEDTSNANLLFVGTEFGLFASANGGRDWKRFSAGLPTVRIDDLLVHPRDGDLIVGTHGRSIWVLDDISPLQELSDQVAKADVHLFLIRNATQWQNDPQTARVNNARHFRAQNPDGALINYHLAKDVDGEATVTISDQDGRTIRTLKGPAKAGLNRVRWNLRGEPRQPPPGGGGGGGGFGGQFAGQPAEPGNYVVKLSVAGKEIVRPLTVEADEGPER